MFLLQVLCKEVSCVVIFRLSCVLHVSLHLCVACVGANLLYPGAVCGDLIC